MKSTLYLKFIFIYIVFGFLSLFTAATLTENLVSTPIFNRVSNSMYREATMVANDYLPGYFSGGLTESDAQMILSGIETQLDAAVWFVSKDGKVILSAQSGSYPSAPDSIKDFDPAESGSDRSQTGDYHGYFDNDVITVTVPVTYGYSPKGYLMIHQYTSVVDTMTDTLMRGVYITFIVIFLLSFIILLAFHFLVYRPLHKITEAATQYASGNLEYEIPVTTEDEMGYLSASLNYMSSQLRDMEDYQKKTGISCKVTIDGYTDFIFVNRFGECQHHSTINKGIDRIIRDCNEEQLAKCESGTIKPKNLVLLPKFSCHSLRHTCATRLCEAGINMKVIQDVLGHADITTTMNIYTEATKNLKKKEIEKFAEFLSASSTFDGKEETD